MRESQFAELRDLITDCAERSRNSRGVAQLAAPILEANAQRSRCLAEHEAAHATVAAVLGYSVVEIDIRDGHSGHTAWRTDGATAAHQATVTAAGDAWGRRLSTTPYIDLSCSDRAVFEREHGIDKLWRANEHAIAILARHRDDVLTLADRLLRDPHLTF